MKTFPMFIKTTDRLIVIIGGGEEAVRKCRLALKTDAQIVVLADEFDPEFEALAKTGQITLQGTQDAVDFSNAAIVFIATGDLEMDLAWRRCAKEVGALVNVVDRPEYCDAYTPSIVDRDPLVVAIGSEGNAPVLARQVKTQLETVLEPRLGELVALVGRLRGFAEEKFSPNERRALWRWVFGDTPRRIFAAGKEREAASLIKSTIESGRLPDQTLPPVALVGAGPGAADLLTLRAVQRLQEADVIFYDRLVDPQILELARRDADRVYVGKTPGTTSWPQDKISAVMISAAKKGQTVVRLKSGDPGIFGRGSEEIDALKAAGLDFEVVPGITAAIAAGASNGAFLTERGEIDTVIFSSGQLKAGDDAPIWANYLRPGASLSIYMGIERAAQIQAHLLNEGIPANLPTRITSNASRHDQSTYDCSVGTLADCVIENNIQAPAILEIRYIKSLAQALAPAAASNQA